MTEKRVKAVIEAVDIYKSYVMGKNELLVLKGVNLSIGEGEIVTVVGPSGVGKSTLLHILGALDKPTRGHIEIDGVPIATLNDEQMAQLRNQRIGFVFQFHHLLPEFTALENVLMPSLIAGKKGQKMAKRAEELLKSVGLGERLSHRPSELSGGEQQRVAVARALMNRPRLVLADEPSGNLDRESSESLHDLIFELSKTYHQTFVIVTHNEQLAERSDRVIKMFDGRISADTKR
ncbi:ABC transporter ATP-binding protein [bacterium]|nr:ABC transporter ATP-binding protein [bacterium]